MRSAQRKARIEKSRKKVHVLGLLVKVFIPLTLILAIFLYLKLSTKYWNGHDKLAFAFKDSTGQIGLTILDPVLNEETTLLVPGEVEVEVARNYGTLRIKNVWQLGINEKLGGSLLAQTLTESFLFPTNLWSDQNLDDIWKFVFASKETNISFGDRLASGIFALRLSGIDKTKINLETSQYLRKQTLTDGKPGYTAFGTVGGRLTSYFADNNFADKNIKFSLTDSTGSFGVAGKVGQILEVLGGKVVAVDKKALDTGLDCEVLGQNRDAVKKVAALFSCKIISGNTNFDLEMKMGEKFAKRF